MPENKCENCAKEPRSCGGTMYNGECLDGFQPRQPEPEKRMTDAELNACVALLSARQFACESENKMREWNGQALAYTDGVDGPLEAAIENELKAREVLK